MTGCSDVYEGVSVEVGVVHSIAPFPVLIMQAAQYASLVVRCCLPCFAKCNAQRSILIELGGARNKMSSTGTRQRSNLAWVAAWRSFGRRFTDIYIGIFLSGPYSSEDLRPHTTRPTKFVQSRPLETRTISAETKSIAVRSKDAGLRSRSSPPPGAGFDGDFDPDCGYKAINGIHVSNINPSLDS